MECHSIPAGELPGATLLYTTFLNDFSRVSEFYSHPPNWTGIQQAAAEIRMEDSLRRGVVDVLRAQNRALGADQHTERNLDRLRDGAVAVVTGQQVGLFGGPAYCVYKALTAIHAARELTEKGTDAVPVFWLATEDHDLAEVNHNYFLKTRRRRAFRSCPRRHPRPPRRRNSIRRSRCANFLPAPPPCLRVHRPRKSAAGSPKVTPPEETFGSAFGKLMTRIFAGRGLIFLDPLSPDLHRFSAPTMHRALREHKAPGAGTRRAFRGAGKGGLSRPSKSHRPKHVALPHRRRPAPRAALVRRRIHGRREIGIGSGHAASPRTASRANSAPARSCARSFRIRLLPTAAYVGGAAEIAYQAQTSVVYQRLLGRAPAILPRAGFTLVPAHVANLLKKYNLQIQDVFAGRHRLHAKMESEALPRALTAQFEQGEKTIKDMLDDLREPLSKLDQTLIGALDTASEKMLYQFNGLRSQGRTRRRFPLRRPQHPRKRNRRRAPPQQRPAGALAFAAPVPGLRGPRTPGQPRPLHQNRYRRTLRRRFVIQPQVSA